MKSIEIGGRVNIQGVEVILLPDMVGDALITRDSVFLSERNGILPTTYLSNSTITEIKTDSPNTRVQGLWQTLNESGLLTNDQLQIVRINENEGFYLVQSDDGHESGQYHSSIIPGRVDLKPEQGREINYVSADLKLTKFEGRTLEEHRSFLNANQNKHLKLRFFIAVIIALVTYSMNIFLDELHISNIVEIEEKKLGIDKQEAELFMKEKNFIEKYPTDYNTLSRFLYLANNNSDIAITETNVDSDEFTAYLPKGTNINSIVKYYKTKKIQNGTIEVTWMKY